MKKIAAALLIFSLFLLFVPCSVSAREAPDRLALSDELDNLVRDEQGEGNLPSFYDPDNPLFDGPQMSSGPDVGKMILYGLIGLIILAAAAVMLWGCLGHRKHPAPPPAAQNPAPASHSKRVCSYCGCPLEADDRFCPQCGAPHTDR